MAVLRIVLVIALAAAGLNLASGADPKTEAYSVIVGTVFQESGLSFPGVKVELASKNGGSLKRSASTTNRGEFTFRVPPDPATYVITASKRGFPPVSVDAEVPGQGRVDVTLTLIRASK